MKLSRTMKSVRAVIEKSNKEVIFRCDFNRIDSYRQISKAIKELSNRGEIMRVCQGVYVGARINAINGYPMADVNGGVDAVLFSLLKRLDIEWEFYGLTAKYLRGEVTQVPAGKELIITGRKRLTRSLKIGNFTYAPIDRQPDKECSAPYQYISCEIDRGEPTLESATYKIINMIEGNYNDLGLRFEVKEKMFFTGCKEYLERTSKWNDLLTKCRSRSGLVQAKTEYLVTIFREETGVDGFDQDLLRFKNSKQFNEPFWREDLGGGDSDQIDETARCFGLLKGIQIEPFRQILSGSGCVTSFRDGYSAR